MSKRGQIVLQSTGRVLVPHVRWCASFTCKLAGLMFRKGLSPGEGLVLVEARPSRSATAIHMLFVGFPIAVIWLDANLRVVDKLIARPWRLFYAPNSPAQYTLEAEPSLLDDVQIGDELQFRPAGAAD